METSLKIIVSLAIGASIGLEREIHQRKNNHKNRSGALLGVRTFSITTLLGAIVGLLQNDYMVLATMLSATFLLVILINYVVSSLISRESGITTELAAIVCYVIGFLIAREVFPMPLTLALAVTLMIILAYKDQVKLVVEDIHTRELKAIISYGIIALVILPFLPNETFHLKNLPILSDFFQAFRVDLGTFATLDIFNPFKTWLIVTIITGVDLVGYILEKMVGKGKGLIVTSLVGGFVSSTATTQSLAVQSKSSKQINHLVGAAMIATFASFFSLIIILLPLNPEFTTHILPSLGILIASFGVASIFFLIKGSKREFDENSTPQRELFSLKPALIFAGLYLSIKILSNAALLLFGETGFLATAGIAGLAGLDAISINIAELSRNTIDMKTSVLAFLIVNAVNLIAKTFYIYLQGKREFVVKYGISMIIIIGLSFIGMLFV